MSGNGNTCSVRPERFGCAFHKYPDRNSAILTLAETVYRFLSGFTRHNQRRVINTGYRNENAQRLEAKTGPYLTFRRPIGILASYVQNAVGTVQQIAEVAELADAHDSNSCGVTRVGSSPTFGTIGFSTSRFSTSV
jgi:hypothetical protein